MLVKFVFISVIPAKLCIRFVFKTDMSFVCVALSDVFVSINGMWDVNVSLYDMSLDIRGAILSLYSHSFL